MIKTQNSFGHYVLTAKKGMSLFNGETYTKVYISKEDIDDAKWTEVDASAVPATDELTDTETLNILLGGTV